MRHCLGKSSLVLKFIFVKFLTRDDIWIPDLPLGLFVNFFACIYDHNLCHFRAGTVWKCVVGCRGGGVGVRRAYKLKQLMSS